MKNFGLAIGAFALVAAAGLAHGQETAYGFNARGDLVSFSTATPGSVSTIGAITGLTAGQTLRSVDFRPNGNGLYGFSADAAGNSQIYTISLTTGAATAVGAGFALPNFGSGDRISIDFNPAVDRLRIVTLGGRSYRANPITGAFVAQDTDLSGNGAGASISAVAYSNNIPGAPGGTTLFAYDYAGDNLAIIGGPNGVPSPNLGAVTTIGTSGLFALGGDTAFDISGATGAAFAGVNDFGGPAELFSVNLGTGAHTLVGAFGTDLVDFSILPAPSSLALLGLGGLVVGRRRR